MKRLLFAMSLLAATSTTAQEVTIKGRILTEEGTAVEYATIGIPGTKNGTLSGIDGEFELTLPQGCNDTIAVSHVSYGDVKLPAALYRNNGEALIVTMQPRELQELTVYNGKRKKAKLAGRGMRFAGAVTAWTAEKTGYEIGSIIEGEISIISSLIFAKCFKAFKIKAAGALSNADVLASTINPSSSSKAIEIVFVSSLF